MKKASLKLHFILALSLFLIGAGVSSGWAAAGNYQVFSFNDLGMHCMDPDFSTLVILPPFNTVHAQVVQKGAKPTLLMGIQTYLTYSGIADPTGSINTTSKGKTNFWTYVFQLFGLSPPVDVGLAGAKMPNGTLGPQPLPFDTSSGINWFTAAGIPITDLDNKHKRNSYPLMNVQAFDLRGTLLSSLSTVLPISSEQHCEVCHATGMDAASPGFYGVQNWSTNPDAVVQYKENILILHDAVNGTALYDPTLPPARKPVLCATCHISPPLQPLVPGTVGPQYLSTAMHRHHGVAPPNNPAVIPIPDDGVNTCYYCHPGTKTKCLRGAMAKAGLICQDCHGGLLAVAGTVPLKNNGFRQPWADLPKCQSCHTGDALNGMGQGIPKRLAYDPADPAATPILANNKRFAEQTNKTLFRFSTGHGMACEACHGSPHAEWPVLTPQGNDNLTAMQIQGHAGPIIECQVCHKNTLAPTLGGPHGLHNINDKNWQTLAGHAAFYTTQPDQCQACHGKNLAGTRLSRAAADRNFLSKMQNPVAVKSGTPISCSQCHQNPLTKF
jgi:hypothetical protein